MGGYQLRYIYAMQWVRVVRLGGMVWSSDDSLAVTARIIRNKVEVSEASEITIKGLTWV